MSDIYLTLFSSLADFDDKTAVRALKALAPRELADAAAVEHSGSPI